MTVTTNGPALVRDDQVIPIWRSVSLVGREDPTTGSIPDIDLTRHDDARSVSRKHARIDYREGRAHVSDLGSTNGTYVNDARLPTREERALDDGERVRFGRVELVYQVEAPWPAGVTPEWELSTARIGGRTTTVGEVVAPEVEGQRHRALATVMFTDVADAAVMAAGMAEKDWRELLATYHDVVRRQLSRFDGREARTTGDGFMATFTSPASAVRCGSSVIEEVKPLSIHVRVGLHTGEVQVWGGAIQGVAVHIAERVTAKAAPDELLVSATLRDLVAGSGIQFSDRGYRGLKGVPGRWRLYAVTTSEGAVPG